MKSSLSLLESCYIYFKRLSLDDEMRSLLSWGVKVLSRLLVRQQIALYLLSDGGRLNRLWLGWMLSLSILKQVL